MTEQDNERYLTDEQAANVLGVSRRTVHRYGENGVIGTRKSGRRTMFHAGDVDALADDLRMQRRSPDPDEVERLRTQLQQATYRIGYLESQMELRLLPDHARQIQEDLAATKAREDELRQQLAAANAITQQQAATANATARRVQIIQWLFIAALIAIAVLVTVLIIGQR